jgi:hypothetical protein
MAITAHQSKMPPQGDSNLDRGVKSGIEALKADWLKWRSDRDMPNIKALKPHTFAPYRENALLFDLDRGLGKARLRFRGAAVPGDKKQIIKSLKPYLKKVAANEKPASPVLKLPGATLQGILLPLSEGDKKIAFILGYFELPDNDKLSRTSSKSAHPDKEAKNYLKLSQKLDAIQGLAAALAQSHGQNRLKLFHTLAQVHHFYRESRAFAPDYARLLQKTGLKQQSRAPFTPILKLAFGKAYDKTRITEYAAALHYAERLKIAPEGLEAFLLKSGGLKACLNAERDLRRRAKNNPSAGPESTAINTTDPALSWARVQPS